MNRPQPEITSHPDSTANWLDLKCPSCQAINRIGVRCPEDGKPCKTCGETVDFWRAWQRHVIDQVDAQTLRDYWADAF